MPSGRGPRKRVVSARYSKASPPTACISVSSARSSPQAERFAQAKATRKVRGELGKHPFAIGASRGAAGLRDDDIAGDVGRVAQFGNAGRQWDCGHFLTVPGPRSPPPQAGPAIRVGKRPYGPG